MPKENPMLQTLIWTREDMAVAQDWELERGNEGVLIWTDLGPELARMVCENPEMLEGLVGFVVGPRARAGAGVRAGEWARAWARTPAWSGKWAGMRSWARIRGWTRAGTGVWAGEGVEYCY